MLFNSYEFLLVFFPAVFVTFWFLLKSPKARLIAINISSFVFYGFWNYKFLPLLLFSTFLDFFLAQKMEDAEPKARKAILLCSVISNLSLLCFFKYFYFLTGSAQSLFTLFGMDLMIPGWEIVLPVGISFYTFQSMSYTIDVYRSQAKAYKNYFLFSAYVCFFPQLIAGPIIRHDELVAQIQTAVRSRLKMAQVSLGIHFFVCGLAKKVLLADRIAAAIDPALMQLSQLNSMEASLCALGYTFQLYFDFSGYTDMAIGLGYFFGLKFPQNFNSPYKSVSITDFWRRWHMTLSRWLRDYLYISLGGNRKGALKTYRNLFLTMLLGGLWHGAGWTYVVWGGFHGLCLALEKKWGGGFLRRGPRGLQILSTFLLVVAGWIFFRSPDMSFAQEWFAKIFDFQSPWNMEHFTPKTKDRFFAVIVIGALILFRKNTNQLAESFQFSKARGVFYGLLFIVSLLYLGAESPFLYFQF